MPTKTKPKMINVPMNDLDALKLRLSQGAKLAESETEIILSILNIYQWMYVQLESAKLTLHRLTKMLGFNSEKNKGSKKKNNNSAESKDSLSTGTTIDNNLLSKLAAHDLTTDGEIIPEKKS